MEQNVAFMRNVPYVTNWKSKEVAALILYMKEVLHETKGTVLASEGEPLDKIYFVL